MAHQASYGRPSWLVHLVFLSLAFWAFSLHRIGLTVFDTGSATRHFHYFSRLLAFLLIIVGVADKNRRPAR